MSSKPHRHAEVIKAWAAGIPVQYYSVVRSSWQDIGRPDEITHTPGFSATIDHRIKPNVKKYRVALMKPRPMIISALTNDKELERNTDFVRWLTDWIEYEE